MLADDAAVEDVIFAPGNAIEALAPGAVHISMSTISVDLSRRLAEVIEKSNSTTWRRRCSVGLTQQPPRSCSLLPLVQPNRSNAAGLFST
jgi:hypothetical protein